MVFLATKTTQSPTTTLLESEWWWGFGIMGIWWGLGGDSRSKSLSHNGLDDDHFWGFGGDSMGIWKTNDLNPQTEIDDLAVTADPQEILRKSKNKLLPAICA